MTAAQWQWQNPLPQGGDIRAVHFINSNVGWVACWAGAVLKTTDGGETWKTLLLPEHLYSETIWFIDEQRGFVGGQRVLGNDLILATTDGGLTWTTSLSDQQDFRTIVFVSSQLGWASGQGARMWKTTDGGTSWNLQVDFPFQFVHSLSFVDSLNGWGAGSLNRRIHTSNGGLTWRIDTLTYSLHDIQFVDSLHGWQCGPSRIEATTDGGASWHIQFARGATWQNIFMVNATLGWVVSSTDTNGSSKGLIARTTNGGSNWFFQDHPANWPLEDVFFTDSLNGVAVGSVGTILKTTDGGNFWQLITDTVTTQALSGIHIQDESNVWAVGRRGAIVQTTDGGNVWSPVSGGTSEFLRDVCFVDLQNGWVVGNGSTILRTTNAGISWTPQSSPVTADWRDIEFSQYPVGWITGEGKLIKTSDGGQNWITAPESTFSSAVHEIQFTSPTTGWLMGDDAGPGAIPTIYKTSDGGDTWTAVASQNSDTYLSMSFVGDRVGYVSAFLGGIFKTEDGGSTWFQHPTPMIFSTIYFVSETMGWGGNGSGYIFGTTNGGVDWVSQQSSATSVQELKFQGPDVGWAVGAFGTILSTSNGGTTSILEEPNSESPNHHFDVSYNYPNPFNAETKFVIDLKVEANHSAIEIFDVAGRLVRRLRLESNLPGSKVLSWDGKTERGETVSTGIYLLKVDINSFQEIKKILLLK